MYIGFIYIPCMHLILIKYNFLFLFKILFVKKIVNLLFLFTLLYNLNYKLNSIFSKKSQKLLIIIIFKLILSDQITNTEI